MKKVLLLLTSSLLLVACNKTPKFDLQTIKPFVPVEIPEAHDINKESAQESTNSLVTDFYNVDKDARVKNGDFVFHVETKELVKNKEGQAPYSKTHFIDYKNIDNVEMSFIEDEDEYFSVGGLYDTILVHKQTNDYGNVLFVEKKDKDLDEYFIISYTEKETGFSAGSMSVAFKYLANRRMTEYYNRFADYNKFFEFLEDDNFEHTTKFASRGNGSVILETTSTAKSPVEIDGSSIDKVTYKMEYFENLLVDYEYQACSGTTVVKQESLSLTYERPEVELPSYWKLHIK